MSPGSVWVSVCTCPLHICWDWLGRSNLSSGKLCLILTYLGHSILTQEWILEVKSVALLSSFNLNTLLSLKHTDPMITLRRAAAFFKVSQQHLSKYTFLLGFIAIFPFWFPLISVFHKLSTCRTWYTGRVKLFIQLPNRHQTSWAVSPGFPSTALFGITAAPCENSNSKSSCAELPAFPDTGSHLPLLFQFFLPVPFAKASPLPSVCQSVVWARSAFWMPEAVSPLACLWQWLVGLVQPVGCHLPSGLH